MKMLKRLLALAAALTLCCCGAAASTSTEDAMATVNGTPITRQAFDDYLANMTSYYAYYGYNVTSPENAAALKYMSLSTLVQMALMDQKIAELGVALTDAERAAAEQDGRNAWLEDVNNYLSAGGLSAASSESERAAALVRVLTELEEMGYTEQSYVDDALENALYIKLETLMVEGAAVPAGAVEGLYAELVDADRTLYAQDAAAYESTLQLNAFALMYGMSDYYQEIWYIPEGYRSMAHILLPVDAALLESWADLAATWEEQQNILEEGGEITGEEITAQEVENARLAALASVQPQLDDINARLAAGEAFSDLIPLFTADEDMDTAEEIAEGYPVHMDSAFCPAGYRDAAFSLENPGEVSAPFVSDGGVYLLTYLADIPGGPVPLTTELHAALHAQLLTEAETEQYNATMAAWEAEANIIYSEEAQAFMTGF